MTGLQKAWRDFTSALAETMWIPAMLDWSAAFIDRHPWIERIPSPPRWMGLMFWIYACIGAHVLAILYAYLIGYGQ
ncbi:MAG TPA: hypothetical protein PKD48_01850 [Sphingopyxis sp.]|nr:hypothetical protein [Sphingopyxis sp.]